MRDAASRDKDLGAVYQKNNLNSVCFLLPQVSDTENILGIVHTENIAVSAEVYDVSLYINMPEGQWMPPKQSSPGALHYLGRWATKALGMGWDGMGCKDGMDT